MRMWSLILLAASLFAAEWRTVRYAGRDIWVQVIDGDAVYQGDIILGRAADLDRETGKSPARESSVIAGENFRWPGGVVPYTVEPDVPIRARIEDAIRHWQENTNVRLVPRTDETAYVRFRRQASGCSASVGRLGGLQNVNLADTCSLGAIIHEIGHAVGMWHTQSRQDRNAFLEVRVENIAADNAFNFDQAISNGVDLGGYAYESIMHYGATAFSKNGLLTLRTVPPGIPIGLRDGLSPTDVDTVRRIYGEIPAQTVIASNPPGLTLLVDGERVVTPKAFDWAPGTTHTVEAEDQASETARHVFARWSDFGDRRHTITAGPDVTVFTAQFARWVRIDVSVSPEDGGSVTVEPASADGWYPEGADITLRATANEGYSFRTWGGFGFFATHGASRNPAPLPLVRGDLIYIARFNRAPVTTIQTDPPGLQVVIDGVPGTAPQGFAWEPGTSHTISIPGASQTGINPAARNTFTGWSNGGERTQTFPAGDATTTITASFETEYRINRAVTPNGSGTVAANPDSLWHTAGSTVEFTAAPSAGFVFTGWSSGLAGRAPTQTAAIRNDLTVRAAFGRPLVPFANSLVNAASFLPGAVAPGEIVTLFCAECGAEELATAALDADGRVATALAGTSVLFDGVAAPVIYTTRHQVSVAVPYAVAGKSTTAVTIRNQDRTSNSFLFNVTTAAPAFFTAASSGIGQGAFLNQDNSFNSAANPAARGSVVVLFATGEGQTNPPGVDGQPARAPLPRPALPVKVRIGGREAAIAYAGGAPGLVAGLLQLNVVIPPEIAAGLVPVELQIGDKSSPRTVFLAVK